ncbi:MAG TPA: hypothetical protein VF120_12075 [Ktedonobacterales bacterium]
MAGLSPVGGGGSLGGGSRGDAAKQVVHVVEDVIADLDDIRQHLAREYATLDNGTVAEFEVGEVLQAVRKAVVRARKALGEVAQQELPLRLV